DLSDSDPDALFDSPAQHKQEKTSRSDETSAEPSEVEQKHNRTNSRYVNEEACDAALRKELESVRNVNKVIEDVVQSLEKAKGNMDTVHHTVTSASTLLQTWTRILSQTEHNQRLILNPAWQGATRDLADQENESMMRQQAAERREMEEQQRKETARRKAEEEERRREVAAASATGRGRARGRGRATGRAGSTTSTNYVGVGGQGGRGLSRSGSTRTTTGIGRGTRARGRGLG
ncbi:hypothetical protein K402DRAFT_308484, partial [Aulographum hederae CBS 113979]